jgi:hypothetical protein
VAPAGPAGPCGENGRAAGGLAPPFAGQVSGVPSATCSAGKRRPLSWLQIGQKGPWLSEKKLANETKALDAKGKRALADELLAQAAEDEAKEPIGR